MEKLSFTLYEIFGYFLPGVVGVTTVAILFWAFFLPTTPLLVHSVELSKLWYFGLVVISYYAGHVLQGISRSLFKNPDQLVLAQQPHLNPILERVQEGLATHLSVPHHKAPEPAVMVRLCDEIAVQFGQVGDRDVFVYREGFYRGSFAAFILLDLVLVVRTIVPGTVLQFSSGLFFVSRWQLLFVIAVVSGSVFFLFQRYKHFAALRVMRGVWAFVSLTAFQELGKKSDPAKKAAV
jgi:hypothetical protein